MTGSYEESKHIADKLTNLNLRVCLVYEVWSLLYELLVRTTLRNVARLLDVNKFMRILQNTLQQLHEHAISQVNLHDICTEESLAIADSSSATVEASSVEEPKKSRKRKRTSSQVHGMKDKLGSNYDVGLLYFSVCRVVKRLNTLVIGSHDDSQGFVVEHLKASLKGSPEQIAEILGTSLLLANILSRKSYFLIEDHICIVDRCISSCVGFWKTCSATADDPSDQPSNVRRKWNAIKGRMLIIVL